MKTIPPEIPAVIGLEQLLSRHDIWRGYSRRMAPSIVLDSGYATLNACLLGGGWPLGSLIEVCQQGFVHAEWQLLTPALLASAFLGGGKGLSVLLNPPCEPFAQALIKTGMDLDRLLIVETQNKVEFLSSFVELAREGACDAVLAWQPKQSLTYTELRKLLLATMDGQGLYVLFRPAAVQEQSSPASLRMGITLNAQDLVVNIFKQKGELGIPSHPLHLPLPAEWMGFLPRYQLDQIGKAVPKVASITPLQNSRK